MSVVTRFTSYGVMVPIVILWENGKRYFIDSVSECRRVAGIGEESTWLRYKCRIHGEEHYLFYEGDMKWFVEAKDP